MRVCGALAGVVAICVAGACHAADVTLLVGFPPGQGTEVESAPDVTSGALMRLSSDPTYEEAGRFYAERLSAFLPDQPRMRMKMMPGASSLLAARRLLAATPGDGEMLALLGPRVIFEPLVAPDRVTWKADGFAWIGARQRDDDLCIARSDAPVRSAGDLRTQSMFMAALAPGSRSFVYARALNELGGARLTIVAGYGGDLEVARALETDEAQGWCGWSATAFRDRHGDWAREGGARAIVQFTAARDGGGLAIPRAEDLASNDADRAAMRAIAAQTRFGAFALAASPTMAPARVAAWRAAFLAMMRDTETLRIAADRGWTIDPVSGDDLQALATRLAALSPEARASLKRALRAP